MLTPAQQSSRAPAVPFDHRRLDRLMDEAGIDLVVATSKHNCQYLTGGHRADFFDYMDATGVSRYLPVFVYPKGAPEKAAYIGHRLEKFQHQVDPIWTAETQVATAGTVDAMQRAVEYIKRAGLKTRRIAAEYGFLPMDAAAVLRGAFPDGDMVDALFVLERQRAVKSPKELDLLRTASELVIDSMKTVIAGHGAGTTKRELNEAMRREETNRGMTFEYCLLTMGKSLNRAPSEQAWQPGEIVSLDSGGNFHGYIGDVCRMAILGEPDAELEDLLGEIEQIQRAVMKPIRAGVLGKEIYETAEPLRSKSRHHNHLEFLAHGMGMVSHEGPRLTDRGPVPYPAEYAERPLEAGMLVSVETTLLHPERGFIKLEDTVAVTESGHEVYGEDLRGWNRAGTALQ